MSSPQQFGVDPQASRPPQTIVVSGGGRRWLGMLFFVLSLVANVVLLMMVLGLGALLAGYSTGEGVEEKFYTGDAAAVKKIAIVSVEGVLMGPQADFILREIKQADEDKDVAAVILAVDSPGGTISDSDRIYHRLLRLREQGKKPLVALMQGLAASGGYYVSMAADQVIAERSTITGSIGVIATFFNVHKLLDKWGVEVKALTSGPLKDSGSPFRDMTEEERKRWQELIDHSYQQFLDVVAQGRPELKPEAIKPFAHGGVLTARQALDAKLIDSIGYLDDAIEAAKRLCGESNVRVVRYKKPVSLMGLLLGSAPGPQLGFDVESLLKLNVPQVLYLSQWPVGRLEIRN